MVKGAGSLELMIRKDCLVLVKRGDVLRHSLGEGLGTHVWGMVEFEQPMLLGAKECDATLTMSKWLVDHPHLRHALYGQPYEHGDCGWIPLGKVISSI